MTPAAWISLAFGLLSMVGSGLAAWMAVRVAQVRFEQQLISIIAKVGEIQIKLDGHILADSAAHERIRGVEVLLEQTDKKLTDVDGRRHRYQTFNDEANRNASERSHAEHTDMLKWLNEKVLGALVEALKR